MAFTTRDARSEDHALFARFFAALEVPDPTPSPEWWARACKDALFLEEDGVAVAYALAYPLADAAYVMHVVVDEQTRGRGVGRALMHAIAARLRAQGSSRWGLFVKEHNAPAIALYERCGLRVDHRSEALSVPWSSVDALGAADPRIEPLETEHDARVEAALGLPRGRIARVRDGGERVLRFARDDEAVVGAIGFDPEFPGAPLFRARTTGVAAALLRAVRSHARPEHDELRLTVDADPGLVSALVDAGARRVLSLLHMEGAIPHVG